MDQEEALAEQATAVEKDTVETNLDRRSERSFKSNRRSEIQSWLEDISEERKKVWKT